jgi:hypothetical protein
MAKISNKMKAQLIAAVGAIIVAIITVMFSQGSIKVVGDHNMTIGGNVNYSNQSK